MHARPLYDCPEALRALDSFIDRELPADEMLAVEAHLHACEACAGDFAFRSSLFREIKSKMRRIDVPAGLVARVLLRLAES